MTRMSVTTRDACSRGTCQNLCGSRQTRTRHDDLMLRSCTGWPGIHVPVHHHAVAWLLYHALAATACGPRGRRHPGCVLVGRHPPPGVRYALKRESAFLKHSHALTIQILVRASMASFRSFGAGFISLVVAQICASVHLLERYAHSSLGNDMLLPLRFFLTDMSRCRAAPEARRATWSR
jgi:hypothetical protein